MLRQIKYFQAITRCGNFTDAAEECYISQSAISQQIQALEKELGVKLIDRSRRKIALTPAGEHFYARSLVLTADFEKLCRETVKIAQKDAAQLRIGYLRCYGGQEFQLALAAFSAKYPEVDTRVVNGNHEELYDLVRMGGVDMVINDQRRAFSDEYVNFELVTTECAVELSARHPLAGNETVEISQLKDTPCILISSPEQRENERAYYRDIVGFGGDFLFAENLEEARMLVVSGRGVMPIEGGNHPAQLGGALCRIPLTRGGKPIRHKYCAFWKVDNSGYYVEAFAELLKAQFSAEQ